MPIELTVDGTKCGSVPIDLLAERLSGLKAVDRGELWLNDSAGAALCVLKSGSRALVMCLRRECDPGVTSRASDHHDAGDLEFTLSNGQVDRYPAAWTIAFEEAARAAEYFWFRREPAPFVLWHEEADQPYPRSRRPRR